MGHPSCFASRRGGFGTVTLLIPLLRTPKCCNLLAGVGIRNCDPINPSAEVGEVLQITMHRASDPLRRERGNAMPTPKSCKIQCSVLLALPEGHMAEPRRPMPAPIDPCHSLGSFFTILSCSCFWLLWLPLPGHVQPFGHLHDTSGSFGSLAFSGSLFCSYRL